jgi:archaetidylinositol phosphate synthase
MMKREEFFASWSALHLDAEIKGIVKGWLSISYVIARGLSALRITPNVLTLLGVLSGVALLFYPYSAIGLLFLVLSLILRWR